MERSWFIFPQNSLSNASLKEILGSVFDLWFLLPVIGLMVGAEKGGSAHDMGIDLLYLGGAWLLSAILFRTPLPLQPLKVWAFLFLIIHPTPFLASISASVLGLLLFGAGRLGLLEHIDRSLGKRSLAAVRKVVTIYVRMVGGISLTLVLLHSLAGYLPIEISAMFMKDHSPGTMLSILLLVLPQFPVTLINGVLATVKDKRESGTLSPEARVRLTGNKTAQWLGLANILAGFMGILPFCHGSGGLWFYKRQGVLSVLPSIVSSGVLLCLGSGILLSGTSLPGPAFFTVFLVTFLLFDFFLQKKIEKKTTTASGAVSEALLEDPAGFWILAGGMFSASIALGGIPMALVFILGVKTAMAFSCGNSSLAISTLSGAQDRMVWTFLDKENTKKCLDQEEEAISGMKIDASKTSFADPVKSDIISHSEEILSAKGLAELKPIVDSPGLFRRPREIPDLLFIFARICLFSFFLSRTTRSLFPTIESDTTLRRILPGNSFSPRAP